MSSNLLSRFLPPAAATPSVYEVIREHDDAANLSDAEDRRDTRIDEQNLEERFHDGDIEGLLAEAAESETASESAALFGAQPEHAAETTRRTTDRKSIRPKWMQTAHARSPRFEDEDEVPESLLFEEGRANSPDSIEIERKPKASPSPLPPPVPGPPNKTTQIQWDTTRAQQQLYNNDGGLRGGAAPTQDASIYILADPKEKAMWRWTNVENLDNFLNEIYVYYLEKGIWSILLSRILRLLTSAFVVCFATFLTSCLDYRKVRDPDTKYLSQIMIAKCTRNASGWTTFFLWLFTLMWFWNLFQSLRDIRRLRQLHDFYAYSLDISNQELQTISWQEIVGRLMDLREENPRTALNITPEARKFVGEQSKQRMDAHDIANRLMRRENYLIALFNKDILDLTLPIPYLRNRQLFSRTLEWNINLCVMDFVFNDEGQVRQLFLKDTHRRELIETLRRRFLIAGCVNVICTPFIIMYLLVLYFLRYFAEFQKQPASIGSRAYTPLAEWKFREFNELHHLFERRKNMSYPSASRYLDQFPKDKTVQVARFIAFVAGAIAAGLFIVSLLDPDDFFSLEMTPNRNVLFYATVFTTASFVVRSIIPAESEVFDPEYEIQNVIEFTHYQPAHWKGRLYSEEVRQEFSQLYKMKVQIFLEEILSLIFTPFVLWFSLPKCSERLIDFFREFTVHVDGLGYVCSFALFNFNKGGNNVRPTETGVGGDADRAGLRDDYYATKDNKMLASYYNFIDNYAGNVRNRARKNPRRQFHPPPAFPGLPSARADGRQTEAQLATSRSTFRSPITRGETMSGAMSPPQSLLLDPHHQPSTTLPAQRQQNAASTYRPHRLQETHFENEEDTEMTTLEHQDADNVTSSQLMDNDSHLGDSWKTTRAATTSREEVKTESAAAQDGKTEIGAGVLGLLYEFQRAQTEGRGPGVNI